MWIFFLLKKAKLSLYIIKDITSGKNSKVTGYIFVIVRSSSILIRNVFNHKKMFVSILQSTYLVTIEIAQIPNEGKLDYLKYF
jgi:hypothetical protein